MDAVPSPVELEEDSRRPVATDDIVVDACVVVSDSWDAGIARAGSVEVQALSDIVMELGVLDDAADRVEDFQTVSAVVE